VNKIPFLGPGRMLLAALATMLMFSHSASADEKTGFNVNGGIGASVLRDKDGTEVFQGNSFGWLVGGEFRFNTHFALGFAGYSLGSATDTIENIEAKAEASALELTGRIIWPVSEKTEIFTRIGRAAYFAEIDPGGFSGLFGSGAWVFGGGVDFYTSEQFAIRLEGRFLLGENDETGGLATIGFSYNF